LGVNACGHHLEQWRGLIRDRVRQTKDVIRVCDNVFRKATVNVAADEPSVRTKVSTSHLAVEATATIECGIQNDSITWPNAFAGAYLDNDADHLVTHDQGIRNGDRAAVDLEVRSTNTAVRYPDQHMIPVAAELGDAHPRFREFARSPENHGLHELCLS